MFIVVERKWKEWSLLQGIYSLLAGGCEHNIFVCFLHCFYSFSNSTNLLGLLMKDLKSKKLSYCTHIVRQQMPGALSFVHWEWSVTRKGCWHPHFQNCAPCWTVASSKSRWGYTFYSLIAVLKQSPQPSSVSSYQISEGKFIVNLSIDF